MSVKVTYRKAFLPWVIIILLIFLTYHFILNKTWDAYVLNRHLRTGAGSLENLNFQPGYLQRKNRNLDRILSKYLLDSLAFRGSALAEIATIAEREQVRLTEIPAQSSLLNSDKLLIQQLNFEGDYYSLLRFVQKLHQQNNVGVVRSLKLKVISPNASEPKKLVLETYLQIVKR